MDVKICGLTNLGDARGALDAGADYLGFVLYEKSPRSVTPMVLGDIVSALGDGARAIGVFVNESPQRVAEIVAECGLHGAQIHGDEEPVGFGDAAFPVWRAVWLKGGIVRPVPAAWKADRYVIDAAVPGQYGGSGVRADWDAAAEMAQGLPVMLAGGLTAANVADAVRAVRPLGVDVSSGVEREPGRKDLRAVCDFVKNAKRVQSE